MLRFDLRFHEALPSTNDEACRLARAGAQAGTAVLAGEQLAGRGRQGRPWTSPPGNLHLSLVLRPAIAAQRLAELGFVAALAASDALDGFLCPPARIVLKWPNDLLVGGAKLGGILLESELDAARVAFVVVGIGANLRHVPPALPFTATSLAAEGERAPTPEHAARAILGALGPWLARWEAEGFAPVRSAWLARASGLGGTIRLRDGRAGRFAGMDADGALLLEAAGGTMRITAGEVAFG